MSDDEEKEKISGTVFANAWDDPDIDMTNPEVARVVLEVAKNVEQTKSQGLWYRITAKFSKNLPEAIWKGFLFLAAIFGAIITIWSKG